MTLCVFMQKKLLHHLYLQTHTIFNHRNLAYILIILHTFIIAKSLTSGTLNFNHFMYEKILLIFDMGNNINNCAYECLSVETDS